MKILFCTDGSKISFNAIRNFSGWVKDATVDIVCVIDWSFLPDEVSIEEDGFATSCANVADGIIKYAENIILNELKLKTGRKIKQCGSAIDSILEQLKCEKYDFVVLGSHGKKGIQKWLGSVSQEIVNSAEISSFITKHPNNSEKILFTTDGTDFSTEIIKKVIEKFTFIEKEIYVCTVYEEPDLLFLEGTLDTDLLLSVENQQKIYASKTIKNIENYLKGHNLHLAKSAILRGNPAQKIIEFSKSENIDLIIMGTHKRSKIDSFLMGSVSKRILENSPSDCVIIKP